MVSPFRLNKKARRRERKMASKYRALAVQLQEPRPEIAKLAARSAEQCKRAAQSRRKKKPKNSN
jgi:hypothetical protein